jgi:hypothetical protein
MSRLQRRGVRVLGTSLTRARQVGPSGRQFDRRPVSDRLGKQRRSNHRARHGVIWQALVAKKCLLDQGGAIW